MNQFNTLNGDELIETPIECNRKPPLAWTPWYPTLVRSMNLSKMLVNKLHAHGELAMLPQIIIPTKLTTASKAEFVWKEI